MKTFITIAVCLFSFSCFSQTKLVSFRSHSGNNTNFRTAVEGNMFDIGESNFGNPPTYREIHKVDTVIYKSSNELIFATTVYNVERADGRISLAQKVRFTATKQNAASYLVVSDLDSLKQTIKNHFANTSADSIVFIGFDKRSRPSKKQPKHK